MAWKQKHRENITHLVNKGGFICLRHNLCRTGLQHYYCTTESIHKSLKPLVDESETSHHIVLSVVRESETCHKKSQPSQKKSETCVNCVILSTSWLYWLPCGCNSIVQGTPRLSILFHRIPFSLTFYLAKDPLSRKCLKVGHS